MVDNAVSRARRLLSSVPLSRLRPDSLKGETGIALALIALAVVFNLYFLYPEVGIRLPKLNDGVLHVLALRRAVDGLGSGDPTDPWLPNVVMGYPLFHYYQHLAYFPPAVASKLLSGFASIPAIFNWTNYLLLSLFPVSIYWSMRRFGFSRLTSAFAGLASSLLATNGLFGFDYNSYVWRGYGLYTQAWGMLLLPPALAQGYAAMKEGRGYFWAVLLLAATALSHLVFGYIALVSLAVFAVLSPSRREIFRRSGRLAFLLAFFALATAYFFVPLLRDSAYLNRSVFDTPEKYDSYGFSWVVNRLISGELFDYGRFPSFTILAAVGLGVCLWRWREERFRVPAVLSVLWLLLYMGRPVWGFLFDLQPLGHDIYLHRLIAGVHLGGILLIGLGLELPWRWAISRGGALSREGVRYLLVPAALTVALLYPVVNERVDYYNGNESLMHVSESATALEKRDTDALVAKLKSLPPGRVYAGLSATWGEDYRVGYVPMYSFLSAQGVDMLGRIYHPWSFNGDIMVLLDESRPEEYNLFNVRYVVAPKERTFPDFVRPIQDFGRHRLYGVETSGYFDLVGSPVAFKGDKSDFYPAASTWFFGGLPAQKEHPALYLAGGAPDAASVFPLRTAAQVIPGLPAASGPSRGEIVSQNSGEDSYSAVVKVERESYLLLKITYHPNWHAYVDGREVDTVMLMPSFEAVHLTPGAHLVRFEYRPPALRGYLILMGLLSLVLLGIGEWRRKDLAQAAGRLKLDRLPFAARLSDLYVERGDSAAPEPEPEAPPPRASRDAPPQEPWPSLRSGADWMRQRLAPLTSRVGAWSHRQALLAVLTIAIVARLALAPLYAYLPGNALDEYAWMRWMQAIHEHGILNVFRSVRTDYVGYHWVLWLLSAVYGWAGGAYGELRPGGGLPLGLHLLLKAPPLVFDLGLILAVYAATRVLTGSRALTSADEQPETEMEDRAPSPAARHRLALSAAAVIALHPAVLYDGAVWAQIDAAVTLAMLASLVLVARGYAGWGWSAWAAGFLVKPHPIIILPILAALTLRRKGWGGLGSGALAAGLVALAGLGPWIMHGDLGKIVDIYRFMFQGGYYANAKLSLGAWNFWWFTDVASHPLPHDAIFSAVPFLTYSRAGLALSAGAAALALAHFWPRPSLRNALVACSYLAFAFYMFPTATHERYMYPMLGLLLPVVVAERRWLWLYVAASATFFLNLVAVAPPVYAYAGRWDDSAFSLAIAAVNVALFASFTFLMAQEAKAHWGMPGGQAEPSDFPATVKGWMRTAAASPRLADYRERLTAHLPFLGALAVITVLAGLPLFDFRAMAGHDALAYLPRNVEFYEGLKAGVMFPRWAADLNWGYGEPTFNFNPPLFYYISAFFHALGFSFIASENLAIFTLLLGAGLGMYLLASQFFGRRGGLVSAVAYLFAPFLLSRLYVSHALADFTAFAPMPLAFWALYRYTDGGRYAYLAVGAAAVALLVLSSGSISLIVLPALALFVAWLAWSARRRDVLARGAWCLLLGLGLSAFFLLPALAETGSVHLERRAERIDFHDHFLYLRQLVYSSWGYGFDVKGPDDGMSFAAGPVHLALAGAALLLIRRIWAASRPAGVAAAFFLAIMAPAVFFTNHLSVFFWERLPLIDSLQFPMRFLSLIALSTAFLCGFPFLLIGQEKHRRANVAMAAVIGVVLLLNFSHAKPDSNLDLNEADFSPRNIAANGIAATAREFEPIGVKEFPKARATERLTFVTGSGDVIAARVSPFDYHFVVQAKDASRLRVNTFYFPGWSVSVDGTERRIDHSNPQGLMEFTVGPGTHLVEVHFGGTAARTWGTRLSLLALLCLLATPWLGPRGLAFWRRARARVRSAEAPVPGAPAAFSDTRTGKAGGAVATAPVQSAGQTRAAVGLYLLLLALYLATAPGHFFSTEEVAVYQTARSITEDGNLEISPIQDAVPRNGKWYSVYEPGQSVASIPLYVAGSVTDSISSPSVRAYFSGQQNYRYFGGNVPIFFVSHFNQLVTPLLCVLIYLFCLKLGFSLRASFATAIVYGVGTLAWPQAVEYFQHPLETLFLLSTVYVLFSRRYALRPGDVLLASALLACGVQTRFSVIVTVPVLFGYLAWLRLNAMESRLSVADPPGSLVSRVRAVLAAQGWGVLRSEWRYVALFVLPQVVALGLSLWLAHFRTGDWLAIHGGGLGVEATAGFSPKYIPSGVAFFLLSPGRSVLLYSPPLLAAAFGFRRFWKEHTDIAVLSLGIGLAYLALYASFQYPHGGLSWGPRYLYPAFPLLIIPVAYLFEKKTWAVLVGLLTAAGAAISLLAVTINLAFAAKDQPPHNYHYLWTIAENPLALHFKDFFAGRNFDLWLQFVLHNQGTGAFVATVVVLALIPVAGVMALRGTGILSLRAGDGRADITGEAEA